MKEQIKTIVSRYLHDDVLADIISTELWNLIFESRVLTTTEELRTDLIRAVNYELLGDGEPDD
ncbi:MAG: hypothetical protein PHU54_07960 [Candidatus Omnitrophica bacterium]|nr:hypothetical protein [Candidatus Omnitrophota bacterium]